MKKRLTDAGRTGYRRCKRGGVKFVTKDKTIQAFMTAAAFGIISKYSEGTAAIVTEIIRIILKWAPPQQYITALLLVVVFSLAYWADNNTEEWRNIVAMKTGEKEAVEEAEMEDEEDG